MSRLKTYFPSFGFLLLALVLVVGSPAQAASTQSDLEPTANLLVAASDEEDVNDPLEQLNRLIFEFNELVQALLLKPLAGAYNQLVPATARVGIANFIDNLGTPVTLANNLLQGDAEGAVETVGRFLVNSTMGIGGLGDVAAEMGVEGRQEDFGQTLGTYGLGEGFYLVLPVFGPSNPRDAVGKFLIDPYFDPFGLWMANTDRDNEALFRSAAEGIVEYAGVVDELDQVRKTSVDYYAAIRSLYRQKRKAEISNGEELELPPIPDLGYDLNPEDFNQPLAGADSLSPTAQ